MKYLLYLLSSLFVLAGCGPDNSQTSLQMELSVDTPQLEFPAEGGEQTFMVTSSEQFYLVPGDKWLTVKKGAKVGGYQTPVTVTVEKMTVAEDRKTRISVVSGEDKIYVDVIQTFDDGEDAGNIDQPAQTMGIGWNLGNHFDAYSNGVSGETVWGNPKASQATFNKVRAAGFSTVRIPVTWMGHIGEAPDYKISEAWLNRVAEVVGYAENAGLFVILNMHHDGADSNHWLDIKTAAKNPEVHEQIKEQIAAMWSQIADKFQDKGDFLIFEAFNEIHDGGWGWGDNRKDGGKQYQCLNEWNQTFVDAVRGAAGENNRNRMLGIPAYCTNVDIAVENFVMPKDVVKDRMMMSVHCYDPYDYTLPANKSEWGHTASASKKVAGNNEADLEKVFVKLYDNFVSKGIPVYMGEFGCVNRATAREQAFQQYYFRYYAKLSKMYGVPSILWDNGAKGHGNEKHAFIDHGTGQFCSKEAEAAIKALIDSYNNDLTLEQVYNNAPK